MSVPSFFFFLPLSSRSSSSSRNNNKIYTRTSKSTRNCTLRKHRYVVSHTRQNQPELVCTHSAFGKDLGEACGTFRASANNVFSSVATNTFDASCTFLHRPLPRWPFTGGCGWNPLCTNVLPWTLRPTGYSKLNVQFALPMRACPASKAVFSSGPPAVNVLANVQGVQKERLQITSLCRARRQ